MTNEPVHRVVELWAFVVTDASGAEGILRRDTPFGTQPMIGDSYERAMLFRDEAVRVAAELQMRLELVYFTRVRG